jgi:hypothetical protein
MITFTSIICINIFLQLPLSSTNHTIQLNWDATTPFQSLPTAKYREILAAVVSGSLPI